MGGPDTLANLQVVHSTCNRRKANTPAERVAVSMPRVLRPALVAKT
jgi:hypothetical protein